MDEKSVIRQRKRVRTSTTNYAKQGSGRAQGGEYTFLVVTVVGSILLVILLLMVWHSQVNSKNAVAPYDYVPDPFVPQPPSSSELQQFSRAAVCTDGPPCSNIGRDILMKGGGAVDAAIAALFCNGVVNSQSMGIGGGFMMTLYVNKTAYSVTAREKAPKAADKYMFKMNPSLSRTGGLAVGVPGELLGYWEVWKRFGVLEWRDLIQPSIDLCYEGYRMNKAQYDSIFFRPGIFDDDPVFREMFVDEYAQQYYKPGSLIRPKTLCDTYKVIAEEGGMALNNGSLTKGFVEDIREHGGIITEEDMNNYRVEWSKPVAFPLKLGYNVYSAPPPASGLLLAHILQILEDYELTDPYTRNFASSDPNIIQSYVTTLHRMIEAFKFAFAKRDQLGDPYFVDIKPIWQQLISKKEALKSKAKIVDNATFESNAFYGSVSLSQDDHGTAHLAILSASGDAVSVTSTINLYFGAGFISKSTGIIPNSVMDDFASPGTENFFGLKPSKNHFIEPGKRPLSSACPTIVTDSKQKVVLIIGGSGGTKIPTAVAWVMIRHLWFHDDIKEAIDSSRIHHQLYPMKVEYEYGLTQPLVEGLRYIGHRMERYKYRGSIVCAISRTNGTIYSNADFRKGGEVSGF